MRLSCLLSAIALALVGCAEPFSADHFRGVQGCWLTSRTCEVFVSGKPYPRVVAFRVKGRSSPFRVSTSDQFYGMRTWFIEPAATEDLSLLPSTQPAVVDRKDALSATITAEPEPKSGLQVFIEVTLDADKPTLTVRHGLKNLQAAKRRLSVWAICAVEHNGMAVVPWKAGKEIKNCVLYPESDPSELCLKFGRQAMGVDYRIPSAQGQLQGRHEFGCVVAGLLLGLTGGAVGRAVRAQGRISRRRLPGDVLQLRPLPRPGLLRVRARRAAVRPCAGANGLADADTHAPGDSLHLGAGRHQSRQRLGSEA